MGGSLIGVSLAGDSNKPSPSIFGDCPNTLLNDKGLGYFGHEDFLGNTAASSLTDGVSVGKGILNVDADTGTIAPKTGEVGGWATLTTGSTDNNAIALVSQPIGKIVRSSGNKVWFEANLELSTLFDGALFVGLGEEAAATRDAVADDPSNSAQAGLATDDLVGFVSKQTSSAIASLDAIYRKGTATVVTALSDVTNSTQLTHAGGTAAALAATTPVKLGIYYNGRDTVSWFVNGYKVAAQDVDSTFPQSHDLCAIVAVKTGAAAAKGISVDFIRYALQG